MNTYEEAKLKAFAPEAVETIAFLDQETWQVASDYVRNCAPDVLYFTQNGVLYIPMPVRSRYPGYMDYLRSRKGIAGTLAIVIIPSSSSEQPLGHTYPSLRINSVNRYIPLHTGCSRASRTPGYFSGETSVPAAYETKEITTPIGAAVFIGVTHRQNDILMADHILAQHAIDVPQILNYRAMDRQGHLVLPESGIINCVTFSVDYFAKGVGIDLTFPFTNDSRQLIETARNLATDSATVTCDVHCFMGSGTAAKSSIIISRTSRLSHYNPTIFVDAMEVHETINRFRNDLDAATKKSLQAFTEDRLITLLLEQHISVRSG